MSSSLQIPELRLPPGDKSGNGPGGGGGGGYGGGGGGGGGSGAPRGTVPLLLVPPSSVPRRRHSWICR